MKLAAGILEIRKGFKVVEDLDTNDTYGDDEDGYSESSDDSAWDEYEVRHLHFPNLRINLRTCTSRLCITLLLRNCVRLWSWGRSSKVNVFGSL